MWWRWMYSAVYRWTTSYFLGSEINDDAANTIIAQLFYISSQRTEDEIKMYIDSPGGSVSAGLAIYDTMKFIPNEISTICTGIQYNCRRDNCK